MSDRRLHAAFLIFVSMFLLSGCFTLDADLTIKDQKVRGVFVLATDDEVVPTTVDEDGVQARSSFEPVYLPDHAGVEPYEEDGKTGTRIILDGVPLDEFNKMFDPKMGLTLTHDNGEYELRWETSFRGQANPNLDALPEEEQEYAEALMKSEKAALKASNLTVKIEFPHKVTDTNGDVKGTTVSWDVDAYEPINMWATAEGEPEPENDAPNPVVALLFAGVASFAMWVFWKKRKTR